MFACSVIKNIINSIVVYYFEGTIVYLTKLYLFLQIDCIQDFVANNIKNILIIEYFRLLYISFSFFLSFFFNFKILYWFCHTLTWIYHGCICIPHPKHPSHLLPHPIPLGHPSSPASRTLYHASNLDWRFISHMMIYMFQCHSPKSSHPLPLPQSPKDCSIHLSLLLFCIQDYRYHLSKFHV